MSAPACARPAYWRGLTTFDRKSGAAVLSFQTFDGEVVRLQLNQHDLEAVHEVTGNLLAGLPGAQSRFPIGDRTADGEAPRRDLQGSGGEAWRGV